MNYNIEFHRLHRDMDKILPCFPHLSVKSENEKQGSHNSSRIYRHSAIATPSTSAVDWKIIRLLWSITNEDKYNTAL